MGKQEANKRIKQLRKVINQHNYLYHVLDNPDLSDAAFDSLKHELYKLEQEYPDLITSDSPTQRVSGKALDKFEKVKHKKRMLSLEDIFYVEEFEDWQERIQKLVPSVKLDYFTELKIDGFAVSLIYKNGIFIKGATRGDGKVGENVTQNLKTITSIPLKLEIRGKLSSIIKSKIEKKIKKGQIEIRGEVYMSKSAFEEANKERKRQKLSLYANPRNTAAGSIRQLNPEIAASRKLNFLAYDVVTDLGQKTHQQEHEIAKALGFKTGQESYCKNIDKAVNFWNKVKKIRNRLPYQIDGVVISVNNSQIFNKLGIVGKAPRGAIAFKFPAKEATTIVENIVIQIGRTGALTPVAHLKPVRLDGILITKATLHNEDEIKRLDIRINDTVIVQRAGDVIPDIVRAIKKLRTGKEKKFQMPKQCPVCKSKVIRPKGEAIHRCLNKNCNLIQKQQIIHFVSKKGFEIDGLGPKIIKQLIKEGLIVKAADLFSLTQGDLIPLERFDQKSANNLIEAIEKSKKISFSKFIFALGIRHTGEETSISLAQYFGSLDKLKKANIEEFSKIEDVGEVVAKSIFNWFNSKDNIKFLNLLINSGVEIKRLKLTKKKLAGKTFVLTGELDKFTRDEAKTRIRELGGSISSSVSVQTSFVVIGKNPGSKYNKAKKIGVKIINEKEFLRIIE